MWLCRINAFGLIFTYAADLFSDGQNEMLKMKGMRFPKEVILVCAYFAPS